MSDASCSVKLFIECAIPRSASSAPKPTENLQRTILRSVLEITVIRNGSNLRFPVLRM